MNSIAVVGDVYAVQADSMTVRCSEVVVATGHSSRTTPIAGHGRSHSLGPYPIDRPGGVCEIGPG